MIESSDDLRNIMMIGPKRKSEHNTMKQLSFLSNLTATVTITTLFVLLTVSGASAGTPQKIGAGYDIEMSRMIPMRDGIRA